MKRINHVVLMLALAAASFSVYGQQSLAKGGKTLDGGRTARVAEEILRLDREYNEAFGGLTAEQFERWHTDDFTMTARGMVMTRAEMLARIADPNRPRDVIESLTETDVKARIYGDTAVTTGRWQRVSKNAEGKDTSAAGFFTRVWVKRNNRWQIDVAHYSLMANQAKKQ